MAYPRSSASRRSSPVVHPAMHDVDRRVPRRPEAVGDRAERLAHEVRVGEAGRDRRQQDRARILRLRRTAGRSRTAACRWPRWCRRSAPRGTPARRAGRCPAPPSARRAGRPWSSRAVPGSRTRRWPCRASRCAPTTRAAAWARSSAPNSGGSRSGNAGCSADAREIAPSTSSPNSPASASSITRVSGSRWRRVRWFANRVISVARRGTALAPDVGVEAWPASPSAVTSVPRVPSRRC